MYSENMIFFKQIWLEIWLPVVIYDSVKTVSYGQNSAVPKLLLYCLLDKLICLEVHGRRRLVQNEDLGLLQKCSGQTE